MKKLLGEYSYSIVKMLIYQLAIGIFGAMISMATFAMKNDMLSLVVGVLSVLFYLFLLYTMTWEIGAKDRISVDVGKKPYRPYMGFLLSLIANIPNFVIAIVYTICFPFMSEHAWAGTVNSIIKLLAMAIEGMYDNLVMMSVTIGGVEASLHYFWWSYFLLPLPAIVVAGLSYLAGHKNSRLGAFFSGPKVERGEKK